MEVTSSRVRAPPNRMTMNAKNRKIAEYWLSSALFWLRFWPTSRVASPLVPMRSGRAMTRHCAVWFLLKSVNAPSWFER